MLISSGRFQRKALINTPLDKVTLIVVMCSYNLRQNLAQSKKIQYKTGQD